MNSEIEKLTKEFIRNIQHQVEVGLRNSVLAALGAGRGYDYSKLPPGLPKKVTLTSGGRLRRKGPIQLCPVSRCGNRAAPVFGMVCAKHKDLPKATIKKYRDARRAKKSK